MNFILNVTFLVTFIVACVDMKFLLVELDDGGNGGAYPNGKFYI